MEKLIQTLLDENSAQTTVNKEIGEEILSLWNEYEDGTTPEALFVKDLDKFEMILQAFEYEKRESFFHFVFFSHFLF